MLNVGMLLKLIGWSSQVRSVFLSSYDPATGRLAVDRQTTAVDRQPMAVGDGAALPYTPVTCRPNFLLPFGEHTYLRGITAPCSTGAETGQLASHLRLDSLKNAWDFQCQLCGWNAGVLDRHETIMIGCTHLDTSRFSGHSNVVSRLASSCRSL